MLKLLKKLPFVRRYSTNSYARGWSERKIDWRKDYLSTWNHPHRSIITHMLKSIPAFSLWEVGCGPGPNLVRILKEVKGLSLGGSDVNEDAIAVARETFKGGIFHVEHGDDLLMGDKSVDVLLTDMTLIYVGPFKIRDYIREFKRVARNYVIFVEFHSDSWWVRQWERMNGHHAHDFKKLLASEGFYDIMVQKIPLSLYPGVTSGKNLRHVITARCPQLV